MLEKKVFFLQVSMVVGPFLPTTALVKALILNTALVGFHH